jgi:hypothetical protein
MVTEQPGRQLAGPADHCDRRWRGPFFAVPSGPLTIAKLHRAIVLDARGAGADQDHVGEATPTPARSTAMGEDE